MAFSMHSHSGEFCPGHAKDTLEGIIQRAISLKMHLLALTEHMPRTSPQDLYPEEVEAGDTPSTLLARHAAFISTATSLRSKHSHQISLLIGFECEWIRATDLPFIQTLAAHPSIDFFVGSVHHVHGMPIDFSAGMYASAREKAGGTDERLFEDYFDAQFEMLCALRPRVVGHFDLVRLLSGSPDGDLRAMQGVWSRVVRNLGAVVGYGGLLEVNSSALRKGLGEPYPGRSVCEEFLKMGGKFTLSDDSHSVAQVGLNFKRTVQFLESVGVENLYYLERPIYNAQATSKLELGISEVSLASLELEDYPWF